jgi:hypothetical protein
LSKWRANPMSQLVDLMKLASGIAFLILNIVCQVPVISPYDDLIYSKKKKEEEDLQKHRCGKISTKTYTLHIFICLEALHIHCILIIL